MAHDRHQGRSKIDAGWAHNVGSTPFLAARDMDSARQHPSTRGDQQSWVGARQREHKTQRTVPWARMLCLFSQNAIRIRMLQYLRQERHLSTHHLIPDNRISFPSLPAMGYQLCSNIVGTEPSLSSRPPSSLCPTPEPHTDACKQILL